MSLRDSPHFLKGDLPTFEISTPIREIFSVLAEKQLGGGIIHDWGRPAYYLRAAQFGSLFLRCIREEPERLGPEPEGAPVKALLAYFVDQMAIVPIAPLPALESMESRPLVQTAPSVFAVRSKDGTPLGWFLNRESIRNTATGRARYVCDGEDRHKTFDPDSGNCPKCTGKLHPDPT